MRALDEQIVALRQQGLTQVAIGLELGISQNAVSRTLIRLGHRAREARAKKTRDPLERLLEKVMHAPSGCWEWMGTRNLKGYGCIHMPGPQRTQRAHRVSYELLVGPIPDGLEIDHLCRNRGCINPMHLQPVTRQVNQHRGHTLSARQLMREKCKRGHEYTVENIGKSKKGRRCLICHRDQMRERKRRIAAERRRLREVG